MKKVYVVNRGGHDYGKAERFGQLVFCTEGTLNRYNVSQMYRACSEAMKDSTEEDYILITSLATLNSVACAVFSHKHGRLNLLLFSPDSGDYKERTIKIEELEDATRGQAEDSSTSTKVD